MADRENMNGKEERKPQLSIATSDGETISSSNDLSSCPRYHPESNGDSKLPAAESRPPKRKFRIIDETQLTEEEAKKLAIRRAYNRDCATRARTRTKTLVQQLQQEVRQLKEEKEQMRLNFNELQARLTLAELKNHELQAQQELMSQKTARMDASGLYGSRSAPGAMSAMSNQLLMLEAVRQQQRLQQQQQQQQELLQQSFAARNPSFQSSSSALFGQELLPIASTSFNANFAASTPEELMMLRERLRGNLPEESSSSSTTANNMDLLYAFLQKQQRKNT
jgi:hypothetical protein